MIQIDRRLIMNFDWMLFLCIILINGIGLFTLYSVVGSNILFYKQLLWNIIGLFIFFVCLSIPSRIWHSYSNFIYIISILLLILVLLIGIKERGVERWIGLSFINIQPSEIAKLGLIFVLAHFFHKHPKNNYLARDLLVPFILSLLPIFLIAKQPDLSTAVIFALISIGMIMIAGVKKNLILKGFIITILLSPLFWMSLKDYQKHRLVAFLNPHSSATKYGYHIIQSEIAVGSGGILGKGIESATQSKLYFLPEKHTDFIFSVFAEQWGFIGCFILIFLYASVIWRALNIVQKARWRFEKFTVVGITIMLAISVILNISMTIGLFPVAGITLPFMSYGGSSTILNFAVIGIIVGMGMRVYEH
ncbi:MAG: rod shape-determining protein RodA [Deltaproteobacteria bacterium]|nr:rod shape-determining protein RodA [Deltaproteobacteria bacterium]